MNHSYCWWKKNPAPPGMYKTPKIMGCLPYQLVQDSFPSIIICWNSSLPYVKWNKRVCWHLGIFFAVRFFLQGRYMTFELKGLTPMIIRQASSVPVGLRHWWGGEVTLDSHDKRSFTCFFLTHLPTSHRRGTWVVWPLMHSVDSYVANHKLRHPGWVNALQPGAPASLKRNTHCCLTWPHGMPLKNKRNLRWICGKCCVGKEPKIIKIAHIWQEMHLPNHHFWLPILIFWCVY